MTRALKLIHQALGCPIALFTLAGGVSAFALAAAYIGEYMFGLLPCILCLYQRIPFAVIIALSLLGLALRKNARHSALVLLLCAAAFTANAGIAFYHTGVEQKWWTAGPEGCAVPPASPAESRDLLELILSTPAKDCAEIAWQDPIFGLSMANLNVLLGLGMAVICLIGFVRLWMRQDALSNPQ